jgi:hypothetical protein
MANVNPFPAFGNIAKPYTGTVFWLAPPGVSVTPLGGYPVHTPSFAYPGLAYWAYTAV